MVDDCSKQGGACHKGSPDGVPETVDRCSAEARVVLVVGIPGVGKSLLLKEVAQSAHRRGRRVTCLQWDVVRGPFEACEAGQRYPEMDGVTHPMIRLAAGLWSREAISRWMSSRDSGEILVGELPLVGNRLMEVVRPVEDHAEAQLASCDVRYLLPVPSVDLRKVIEQARSRSAAMPGHARERDDASPEVLQALWAEVAQVAEELALDDVVEGGALGVSRSATEHSCGDGLRSREYRPTTYQALYEHLLRHRNATVMPMTEIRSSRGSVYDIAGAPEDLAPTHQEANEALVSARAQFSDDEVSRRANCWWDCGDEKG